MAKYQRQKIDIFETEDECKNSAEGDGDIEEKRMMRTRKQDCYSAKDLAVLAFGEHRVDIYIRQFYDGYWRVLRANCLATD